MGKFSGSASLLPVLDADDERALLGERLFLDARRQLLAEALAPGIPASNVLASRTPRSWAPTPPSQLEQVVQQRVSPTPHATSRQRLLQR
jgi:hypothetical protein